MIESQNTGFHVPDDEIDSSSESSRSPSVQILDSHVRAYSVPSSDGSFSSSDEEGEISSLKEVHLREPLVKPAAITTPISNKNPTMPNRYSEIWSEATLPEELEIVVPRESSRFIAPIVKSNDSGSSRLRPIDLEDMPVHQKVIPSSDSEDEPPEALSSKQTHVGSNTNLLAPFSTQAPESHGLNFSTYVEREAEHGALDLGSSHNHQKFEKGRIERQFTNLEPQVEESCYSQPTKQPPDESLIADEEDFDNHSKLWNPSLVYNTFTPKNYAVPPTTVDKSQASPDGSRSAEDIISENSQTNVMDISDNSHHEICRETAVENNNKDIGIKPTVTRRPPSPSDAALAKKAKFVDHSPLWPFMDSNMHCTFIDGCAEYQTQSKRTPPIGDATLSNWEVSGTSRPWLLDSYDSSPWSDGAEHITYRPWIHVQKTEPANFTQDRPFAPDWVVPSCIQDSCTKSCGSSAINVDQSTSILRVVQQSKENGTHSSRLNISDIVHPQAESTRSLKRKADEISVDGAEAHNNEESHDSWSESSQDVLPGAQPPAISDADETVLFENTSKILSKADITVQQSPTSESSKPPPQKKVKTTGPTALGIGKFVSGVCFGVAGVFAAFIATIPLSVQEEAMQELVKSA